MDRASRTATGSGRAIARFFGNSSPNTICTTVDSSSASTVPIATPTATGTPTPPNSSPTPAPISGSASVADEQAGDRDAELGAGEHERGAPGDAQRAGGAGVTGRGAGRQPGPVHGHVPELLRHEVPGQGGQQDDDDDSEKHTEQARDHVPTASEWRRRARV